MLTSQRVRQVLAMTGLVAVGSLVVVADQAMPLLGGELEIAWGTIDAGGGTITGGSLELSATIGQPDAGAMFGGTFELAGGYWSGGMTPLSQCPADITPSGGDGAVNIDDLIFVISNWGQVGSGPADVTGNGVVNIDDLIVVIGAWGLCP